MPNLEDDLPKALTPDSPIKRGRLLTGRGGLPGEQVWVEVEGSPISRQFTCATPINSENVTVIGDRVFCTSAPRTSLSRTLEYSRYRPLGVPVTLYPLKISYSTGDENAYIGGFAERPITLTAADVGAPSGIGSVYVDNLGGDDYAIDSLYQIAFDLATTIVTVGRKRLRQNAWSLEESYKSTLLGEAPVYRGRGLWQTVLQSGTRVNVPDSNTQLYPLSRSVVIFDGVQEETGFTYEISGYYLPREGFGYANAWSAYLFPSLTYPFANFVSATAMLDDNGSPISVSASGSASGAVVLAANLYIGVGFTLLYSGSYSGGGGSSAENLAVTLAKLDGETLTTLTTPTVSPTLLSLRDLDSNAFDNRVLAFSNYFLEVDDRGSLRAFKKSDFAALASGNIEIDCLVYDGETLEYTGTEKVPLLKPNNFTSSSFILNVSYHS